MSNAEVKRLAKLRKQFEPVFARQNLTPIVELNFVDYKTLTSKPPEGNLRISRMFLMELERRGSEIAKREGVEFGGLSTYFKYELTGTMTGETSWKSTRTGVSYRLDVDYWAKDGTALTDVRRALALPLYEHYNQQFIKPLGLPDHFELADFIVARAPLDVREPEDIPQWHPLTISRNTKAS